MFLKKNNKGQLSIVILFGMFLVLFLVIYFFVFGSAVTKINTALNQNVSVGQVNLQEINQQTFGKFTAMVVKSADWWGLASIFGMIIGLFLSAYLTRNKLPKFGIILDIFIILAVFLFSLYLRGAYEELLLGLASAGETFLENEMRNTSRFIMNLPIFVTVIGVIMMVLFHSSIPKKKEEFAQVSSTLNAIGG